MTKLCSGQGNPDAAADTAADDDDESNPYMTPFQATQNVVIPDPFTHIYLLLHELTLCLFL